MEALRDKWDFDPSYSLSRVYDLRSDIKVLAG